MLNRKKRYLTLKQQRQAQQQARKLRNAQRDTLVAMGTRALAPHDTPHSRFYYRPR